LLRPRGCSVIPAAREGGYRHSLLLFPCVADRAAVEQAAHLARAAARSLGPWERRLIVIPGEEAHRFSLPDVEGFADCERSAHGRFGAVRPTLALVRPDSYLAYRADPPDAERLDAFLARAYPGGVT
jgi:hypothetical protein